QFSEFCQNHIGLEVRDHSEERKDSRNLGPTLRVEQLAQISSHTQISHTQISHNSWRRLYHGSRRGCRHEDHGCTDVHRREGKLAGISREQLEQTSFFLAATAAQANQVYRFAGALRSSRAKSLVIDARAIRIVARGRKGIVQREPLLGLFITVVAKFMIDRARAQRAEEFRLNRSRKLRRVNDQLNGLKHTRRLTVESLNL